MIETELPSIEEVTLNLHLNRTDKPSRCVEQILWSFMNTLKRLTLKLNYEELDIELNEQNFLAKQVLKNSNYHSQN